MAAGDNAAAVLFLQRATQFDPNFAMAYWAICWAYAQTGEAALAAENARKAFELWAEVSEREKLIIEADYYGYALGDLMKLRRSCELGVQTYPREAIFHLDLGVVSNFLGQYEAALKEHQEAFRLAPYNSSFYRYVVFTYLLLNRAEDGEAAAKEAHIKGLDSNLAAILYGIASIETTLPKWRDRWLVLQVCQEKKTCCWRWRPTRLLISDIWGKPEGSYGRLQIPRGEQRRKKRRHLLCYGYLTGSVVRKRRQSWAASHSREGTCVRAGYGLRLGAGPCLCRGRGPSASLG
jgi:tetratricopeptide (TPR) repeat protein